MKDWKILKTYDFRSVIICLIISFFGALLGFYSIKNTEVFFNPKIIASTNTISKLKVFEIVFFKNIGVAFLLSVVGFYTAGIMTVMIFIWNGLMIGLLLKSVYLTSLNFSALIITKLIPHAPFEILSFCLFGSLGFKGYQFYRQGIKFENWDFNLFPNKKAFIIPICLLVFAAFIESYISI